MIRNSLLLASAARGYTINQSLRFRASNSANLTRTFATPTSSTLWTYSAWVKRGALGAARHLMGASTTTFFGFNSSDQLTLSLNGSTAFTSTAVFRDPTGWYHIVYQQNGSAQTCWVNGSSVATGTTAAAVFNTAISHTFGASNATNFFDGHIAEAYWIDGQALTPSSFGETSTTTGAWIPKRYAGTYGTNGFYLPFNDAASATTISQDRSGNGNNWTSSGISVTSGVTFDQMLDSPTNGTAGTRPIGNYSTLNRLAEYGNGFVMGLSNGNLQSNPAGGTFNKGWYNTIPVDVGMLSYAEATFTATLADNNGGVAVSPLGNNNPGDTATSVRWGDGGNIRSNNIGTSYGTALSANDVVMIAVNYVNSTTCNIWFGRNGTWFASGNPATGANPSVTLNPAGVSMFLGSYHFTNAATIVFNFGQRAFAHTPPSGFVALNTANLSTPTIQNGASAFQATLRTGTGASASVSSLAFQPDLVWIKSRSNATNHNLFDAVRGVNNGLVSNSTAAEYADANSLTAFNSNGYTLGTDGSSRGVNINTNTYVDWAWREGVAYGFDIVTYTGTGAAGNNVAHSLNAIPHFGIVKTRSAVGQAWVVRHRSLTAGHNLRLNTTDASGLASGFGSGGIADFASSSTFTFTQGSTDWLNANGSGATYVAYLWTSIPGFSLFGSYTGNGSADGPFVWCGFRPRFVMIKPATAAESWYIVDAARNTFNVTDSRLVAEGSGAEVATGMPVDFTANGFKLRTANGNPSGGTVIFAAFAEHPFKFSNAR